MHSKHGASRFLPMNRNIFNNFYHVEESVHSEIYNLGYVDA